MRIIRSDPDPLPDKIKELIGRLEERRKAKVFALISPNTLDTELQEEICKALRTADKIETLDILLDSVGGDIDAIYQLLTRFRSLSSKLEVLVPDYAKSGATFFCLGADSICLSNTAELGPLDAQIPDPRKSGEFMSALDAFKALEYLRRYAMETLDVTVKLILERSQLSIKEALEEATHLVSILMTPLYQQVRPLDLGEYNRILAIGEEYGRRVMGRYSYNGLSEQEINGILQRMIWAYPSHSFVIDYDEARRLGLHVVLLDEMDDVETKEILDLVDELIGFVT